LSMWVAKLWRSVWGLICLARPADLAYAFSFCQKPCLVSLSPRALRNRESILSTFESLVTPTEHCIVTTRCPFDDGVKEYIRKIGELPAIHKNIAEYFNYTRTPTTVNTCCVIHQAFRDFTSARIKVQGRRVKFAQICVANFGGRACSPNEWMPILLEKAMITKTKLNMVLRKNPCVWILYPGEKE